MRIHKYKLAEPSVEPSQMTFRKGAELLHISQQGAAFYIWARESPEAPEETRSIMVVGTGWDIPGNARYIATLHDNAGFVWHALEIPPVEHAASQGSAARETGETAYKIQTWLADQNRWHTVWFAPADAIPIHIAKQELLKWADGGRNKYRLVQETVIFG